jgi:hypothetical protein
MREPSERDGDGSERRRSVRKETTVPHSNPTALKRRREFAWRGRDRLGNTETRTAAASIGGQGNKPTGGELHGAIARAIVRIHRGRSCRTSKLNVIPRL